MTQHTDKAFIDQALKALNHTIHTPTDVKSSNSHVVGLWMKLLFQSGLHHINSVVTNIVTNTGALMKILTNTLYAALLVACVSVLDHALTAGDSGLVVGAVMGAAFALCSLTGIIKF